MVRQGSHPYLGYKVAMKKKGMVEILENRKFVMVCCGLAVFFPGAFVFAFPGVMAGPWEQMFEVNKADIGRLMFFVLAGTGTSMYLCGKLLEAIAPRRMIFIGNLLCAACVCLAAYAGDIRHIYAWGFFQGFFTGFVYIPALALAQSILGKNRGLASGIINLIFGGGSAIMAPVLSFLLVSRGYGATCRLSMAAALILGAGAALLIRVPDSRNRAGRTGAVRLSLAQIIAMKPFRYLWLVWAFAGASGISLILLCAPFGQSLGYGVTQYVVILTGYNILNGVGRLVCGRLSDHFPKRYILMTVFTMAAMAYMLMPFFSNLYLLSILAAVVGLAFGALFTVSAPLVTECFGLENFGAVFGLVFTAYGFLAGFLGPWLSGILLDMTHGNFSLVFTGFGLFYLVSAFLITKVKRADEVCLADQHVLNL